MGSSSRIMVSGSSCSEAIEKVLIECPLVAMGYNINKLHSKIQQNSPGRQLLEKLTA